MPFPSDGVVASLARCIEDEKGAGPLRKRAVVDPIGVKNAISRWKDSFQEGSQQDAHEFYVSLMETMQAEVMRSEAKGGKRSSRVLVSETQDPSTRVLGFSIERTMSCNACGGQTRVVEQCNHLSLDLPEHDLLNGNRPSRVDLSTLMRRCFDDETVSKHCDYCHRKGTPHTLSKRLLRLPNSLILHMKRFRMEIEDRRGMGSLRYTKTHLPITFPMELNLKSYCGSRSFTVPLKAGQPCFEPHHLGKENIQPVLASVPCAVQQEDAPRRDPIYLHRNAVNNYSNKMPQCPSKHTNAESGRARSSHEVAHRTQQGAADPAYWDRPTFHRRNRAGPRKRSEGIEPTEVCGTRARDGALLELDGNPVDAPMADIADVDRHLYEGDLRKAIQRSIEEYEVDQANKANQFELVVGDEKDDVGANRFEVGIGEDSTNPITTCEASEAEWLHICPQIIEESEIVDDNTTYDERSTRGVSKRGTIDACRVGAQRGPDDVLPNVAALDSLSPTDDIDLRLKGMYTRHQVSECSTKFALQAVLCHHGRSADCGHFTTDARDDHGRWFRFDDSIVTLLESGGICSDCNRQEECYMLVYKVVSDV